jgi:WD40 repeat protein
MCGRRLAPAAAKKDIKDDTTVHRSAVVLVAFQGRQKEERTTHLNPDAVSPAAPEERSLRVDQRGDALPEGALLRFGSARLRHGGVVRASALAPDGKTLATAGDHSVFVWDLETGKVLHRFPCDHGPTFCRPALIFSPDGKRLGYVRGSFFACVWDLPTGKALQRFERRVEEGLARYWAGCCRFVNQGKELVLCSRKAIETWDVETGKQTASILMKTGVNFLSPDGKEYLLVEGKTGHSLGDARTGKERMRLEVAVRHDGIEDGLAISPDGKTLALIHDHREIQLYDRASGKVLALFPLPDSAQRIIPYRREKYWEYRLAFSTDGKHLLLGTVNGLIHRWDLVAGKELPLLSKHHCAVAGMHVLPDGRTIVSTGADGTIRRWDWKTGQEVPEPESYEGRSKGTFSLDGRWAAIGDARGRIDLWNGRTGKVVRTVQQKGAAVAHLTFSPDGKLLAAAERSGTVRFWQVPSGQPGAVWQRETEESEWYCNGIHFSPDGRLLCISDYPKQIRMIEVASGNLMWKGSGSFDEAFSPDGARLLVAKVGPNLALLDVATGKQRSKIRLNLNIPDGLGVMYQLAFSPDGRQLAVAPDGGSLLLCDGQTCAETRRLADHDLRAEMHIEIIGGKRANQIRALAFSPDGKWLASAGTDTGVHVWEIATGKEALCLSGHEAEVSTLAFSPDGHRVFSFGQDGQGYLWDLKPKPPGGPRMELDALWKDLSGTDAAKAYRAVWTLSDDPRAVAFLGKKLQPLSVPDKAHVAKLIADLDNDSFAVREAASAALGELAELIVPALAEACKTTSSLEQRRRLEELLASLKNGLAPCQILPVRAVQALELAGREEARKVLREWADGAPAARLTQQAKAALARLESVR